MFDLRQMQLIHHAKGDAWGRAVIERQSRVRVVRKPITTSEIRR